MVNVFPSFIQVTLVAGDPVEVQVSVEDEDPGLRTKQSVILGPAYELKKGNKKTAELLCNNYVVWPCSVRFFI